MRPHIAITRISAVQMSSAPGAVQGVGPGAVGAHADDLCACTGSGCQAGPCGSGSACRRVVCLFRCRVSGQALWARMQNSFGYLTSGQGYQGHVFPVVFGETGSMYLTVRGGIPFSPPSPFAPEGYSCLGWPSCTYFMMCACVDC